MKIFSYRYACIIISFFMAGCLLGYLSDSGIRYILLGLFSLAAIVSILLRRLLRGRFRIVYSAKRAMIVCLSIAALAFSMITTTIYYDLSYKDMRRYYGVESRFEMEVTDIVYSEIYGSEFIVKILSCNGEEFLFPRKAEASIEYGVDLDAGDIIICLATIDDISHSAIDSAYYKHSSGVFIACEDMEDIEVVGHSDSLSLASIGIRDRVSNHIEDTIDGDSAELVKSLLLGDKSNLDTSIRLDFKRLGVSHVLALSGLHLSVISLGIEFLLKRFRVHKTLRFMLEILFVFFYAAFTGFSVSVIRAAIMFGAVAMTYFFWTDHDSMTALFIAGFVICLISPYAIIDVGFLLSFLATFGVLAYVEFTEILKRNGRNKKKSLNKPGVVFRLLVKLRDSFLISAFASMVTFIVLLLFFDNFSIFAPIFNLIICPLIVAFIYFSALALPFLSFTPIASTCALFGEAIIWISSKLSSIDGLLQSSEPIAVKIGVILSVCILLIALFVDLKSIRRTVATMLLSVTVLAVSIAVSRVAFALDDSIVYQRIEENEQIVLKSDGKVVVCDFSDGFSSTARKFTQGLSRASVTEIDMYVLTHYHVAHARSLQYLSGIVKIDTLALPTPDSLYEENIYSGLVEIAEKENISVTRYDDGETMRIGGAALTCVYSVYPDEFTHKVSAYAFEAGESSLLYVSDMLHSASVVHKNVVYAIADAESIFFGAHGPKYDGSEIPYDSYSDSLIRVSYHAHGVALCAPKTADNLKHASKFSLPEYYVIKNR